MQEEPSAIKTPSLSSGPIFVIGSPRSGTTLLRLILDSHPHISCGPETSFLIDFEPILRQHWSHLQLYGFPQSYWREKIAAFFDSFQTDYPRRQGKRRWAEKTPHYTPHLEFIRTLFPEAQLIHIIRDGRDVVTSFRNRWGNRMALRGIRQWRHYVTVARTLGAQLDADHYYELRYEQLIAEPEPTLRGLFRYLCEPWHEQVLDFLDVPHDIQPTYAEQFQRQNQKSDTSPFYSSRVGAWRQELPWWIKMALTCWAGNLLRELGYR